MATGNILAACIACGFFIGGCATQSVPGETRPHDFALSITTTQSPADASQVFSAGPAWYVLDADGALRAGLGARGNNSTLPPLVRQLSPTQSDEVWAKVQQSGLALRVFELAQQSDLNLPPGSAGVFLAAGGARRTVVIDPNDPAFAAVQSVTSTLRDLGWVREEQ